VTAELGQRCSDDGVVLGKQGEASDDPRAWRCRRYVEPNSE
jgi:hypothetical protein